MPHDSYDGPGGLRTLATEDEDVDIDLGRRDGATLQPGALIDRYVVEGVLGRGGVAIVYRVRHNKLGTTHALKLLTTPGARLTDRLLAEGRLLAPWQHPNIVRVLDAFEVEGDLALLMELVEGPTLAQELEAHPGGLDFEVAEALFRQLLDAMRYAHERDVIHRDLKSSNILLANNNDDLVARVTDFGIAKILGEQIHSMLTDTRTGALLGTPAYMAPEQVDGASKVDARADLFALGVILYEMLAGVRPFGGASVWAVLEALRQVSHVPIQEHRPDIPSHLVHAIEACLVRSPARRVPDIDTLLGILDGEEWNQPVALAGENHEPPPEPPTARVKLPTPALIGASVLALGAIATLTAAALSQRQDLQDFARREAVSRSKNRLLTTTLKSASLEREAWKHAHDDPSRAMALLRASALLGGAPEESLSRPIVFELIARGISRVIPVSGEVYSVVASQPERIIGGHLDTGDFFILDLDTGVTKLEKSTSMGQGRLGVTLLDDGKQILFNHRYRAAKSKGTSPIRLFDTRTGMVQHTFSHGKRTTGFSVSKDETLAVSSDFHEGLRLWDMATGGPLEKLEGLDLAAENAFAFSPDGKWFAAFERIHPEAVVFDTSDWTIAHKLKVTKGSHPVASFSPDSSTLYTARGDHLTAWRLSDGELLATTQLPTGTFLEGDGWGRLITGSERGGATLVDRESLTPIAHFDAPASRTMAAGFITDTSFAFTASTDRTARIWATDDGTPLMTLRGHTSWLLSATALRDQKMPKVITGGRDKTVRVWPMQVLPEREDIFEGHRGTQHAWSESGDVAALVTEEGRVFVWRRGEDLLELPFTHPAQAAIQIFRFTENDQRLILGDHERCVVFELDGTTHFESVVTRRGMRLSCSNLVTDDAIALRTSSHAIIPLDPETGERLDEGPIEPDHPYIQGLLWSTSSKRGVYHSRRTELVFLNEDLESLARIDTEGHHIAALRLIDDDTSVIVTYWSDRVERWDLATGTLTWRNDTFTDSLTRVHISPDSTRIAVGSLDSNAYILDPRTGRILHALEGHDGDLIAVHFSPDGKMLATSAKDGTVRLWEVETGELVGLMLAGKPVSSLRFRDEETLVAWGSNGVLSVWDLTGQLIPEGGHLDWTGEATNLRVCEESLEVVPVIPYPPANSVWAPEALCASLEKRDEQ